MLVAAVQLTSRNNKKKNLAVATGLMTRAVQMGAELIALPEYFSFIGQNRAEAMKEGEEYRKGISYVTMRDFAKKHGVFILAGTIPVFSEAKDEKRLINRSILLDPYGEEVVCYDKIHLFDAEVTGAKSYRESETFRPGSKVALAETAFGKVGLSVCYDLRFAEIYRTLALRGARVIFVPSAFTMYTGKDHWIPLLRARAIENQVFIIAPAQFGKHTDQKISYGKSCIIDPWGNIIALAPDCETVIVADLDFKFQSKIRKELPCLKHYRKDLFSFPA